MIKHRDEIFRNNKKDVEIGFTLCKESQGKGFASEAVKRVIEHLFTEMKKQRIIACVLLENLSSIALLERLGFKREGIEDKEWVFGIYSSNA